MLKYVGLGTLGLILLLAMIFTKLKPVEPDYSELIKREWSLLMEETGSGSNATRVDRQLDSLFWKFSTSKITKEQIFTHHYHLAGRSTQDTLMGFWRVEDEKLYVQFLEETMALDSAHYTYRKDGSYDVSFYQTTGTQVGEMKDGKFRPVSNELVFNINRLDDGNLQLQLEDESEGAQLYHYVYHAPEVTSYVSFKTIARGILGMLFLVVIAFLFSTNRAAINWNLVVKGLALQIIIALLVLKVPFVSDIFDSIAHGFRNLMEFTQEGTKFLFSSFIEGTGEISPPLVNFAFTILPTIVFFSALMSLLYYWGILQKIVYVFAWTMKRFMKLSGAESLAAAGNVFLGQTESPLLVKPYLLGMTKSEIMCLMTGGMATIAGGVLASYISFLGGGDPAMEVFYAKHLLTASVISAPAAVIAAKILVPETEKFNEDLKINKEKIGTNALEAIANGTTDGLKLAVNVGAMLLVFIALMAVVNAILGGVGNIGGLNEYIATNVKGHDALSMELILGRIFGPIMWVLGVESGDMWAAGELLGTKTVVNEFVGYIKLGEMKNIPVAEGGISERTAIMCTYMLCGFANFASIGIQIGGIGALVPSRKGLLSSLGFKALIGGTLACLFTMVVVGMLI